MQVKRVAVNDDVGLESEADEMGGKAVVVRHSTVPSQSYPDQLLLRLMNSKNVIQRVGRIIDDEKFQKVINEMMQNRTILELINKATEDKDIYLKESRSDDTRWDRRTNTIYISSSKKGSQIVAAILFELNNAANPHKFTDEIEAKLVKLSKQQKELTGPDFFRIAQEMEKDEFISLQNYMQQVESYDVSKQKKETLREKYKDLIKNGQLDYDLYKEQNILSGHTMELAGLQYQNYTGYDPANLETIMPLRLKRPSDFKSYSSGLMRQRQRSKFERALLEEREERIDRLTPELFPDPLQMDSGQVSFNKWRKIALETMNRRTITRELDLSIDELLKLAYGSGYTAEMFADMMENGTW